MSDKNEDYTFYYLDKSSTNPGEASIYFSPTPIPLNNMFKKNEVQKRTFTNWYNDRLRGHLKVSKHKVVDLYEDLNEGILLILLSEQLVKIRRIQRYNKKVLNKIQAVENLGMVLKLFKEDNVKLVNIGKYSMHWLYILLNDPACQYRACTLAYLVLK